MYVTDICQSCNKGEMIPVEHEGIMVCNICAKQVTYLIENEKPSYKEPPKEVCFYAYKRINHFKEILAQFQGKETTQIPHDVIENIKLQIKKERIELEQITNAKTKEILKKLGYNKYYEHIPFIKDINSSDGLAWTHFQFIDKDTDKIIDYSNGPLSNSHILTLLLKFKQ